MMNTTNQHPQFPRNFLWGVATASYQVEGAANEDGRGVSIWDTFSKTPGKVLNGDNGDIACDQYHRYDEDVALMQQLGVEAYRFSIAWPRIFPLGRGEVNPAGWRYYHKLIDTLLAAGIQPVVTLYHWDLPQALQDRGGWANRETAFAFADYARACFAEFGDKVDMWVTINEPPCAVFIGYEMGAHAPGLTDGALAFRAAHHVNFAHGLAVKAFRDMGMSGRIGGNLNPPVPIPATDSERDHLAAQRKLDKHARIFLDPMYGKGYPRRLAEFYPDRPIPVEKGDLDVIATPTDFLSLNAYFNQVVRHSDEDPEGVEVVPTDKPKTGLGWDVTPECVSQMLQWVVSEYGDQPLYITENGCAMDDTLEPDGTCHDTGRVEFLKGYIGDCAKAIGNGIDLRGYFLWSFIDNFEWAYGYSQRFGIVYCDYNSLKRYPKDSYYYYRDLIARQITDKTN
jgi:beta-glucosidase